jgi:hypothetical protein
LGSGPSDVRHCRAAVEGAPKRPSGVNLQIRALDARLPDALAGPASNCAKANRGFVPMCTIGLFGGPQLNLCFCQHPSRRPPHRTFSLRSRRSTRCNAQPPSLATQDPINQAKGLLKTSRPVKTSNNRAAHHCAQPTQFAENNELISVDPTFGRKRRRSVEAATNDIEPLRPSHRIPIGRALEIETSRGASLAPVRYWVRWLLRLSAASQATLASAGATPRLRIVKLTACNAGLPWNSLWPPRFGSKAGRSL